MKLNWKETIIQEGDLSLKDITKEVISKREEKIFIIKGKKTEYNLRINTSIFNGQDFVQYNIEKGWRMILSVELEIYKDVLKDKTFIKSLDKVEEMILLITQN